MVETASVVYTVDMGKTDSPSPPESATVVAFEYCEEPASGDIVSTIEFGDVALPYGGLIAGFVDACPLSAPVSVWLAYRVFTVEFVELYPPSASVLV